MTTVVNLNNDAYDVLIDRSTKWGNPYTNIKHKQTLAEFIVKTRKESIEKYKEYILSTPELLNCLPELKDKRLGCWCKPLECHGDVLVSLIDKSDLECMFYNH
jgi:hypothetical protein